MDGKANMKPADHATVLTTKEPPVEEIARRIVEAFRPVRVVLFGSRARGTNRPDGDVDLFVEMQTDLRPVERMRAVSRLFPSRWWSMDVIVFTPDEVREQRTYRNSILGAIESEGKVLYERASSPERA